MSAALPVIVGSQVIGTALNIAGTKAQTDAQIDSLVYSAEMNEKNASLLSKEWAFNEANALMVSHQKNATAKAQISEAGLIGSLSASNALVQTQNNTDRDVLSLRNKYISKINTLKAQAALDRKSASKLSDLSDLTIASNILSGAGSIGSTLLFAGL